MTIEIKHKTTNETLFIVQKTNLREADLRRTDLGEANLKGANLWGANLRGANLKGANLGGANLWGANLWGANLGEANLRGANLRGANLGEANLKGANLREADLTNTQGLSSFCITPQEDSFIGWKKLSDGIIAKLQIPASAQRVNAYSSRKCRASSVKVLELFGGTEATDRHSNSLLYKKGLVVKPDSFNPDPRIECTNGIHFFITRQEAEEY